MATLSELEGSIELSRPVELYTFTVGSTTYRYTNAQTLITHAGTDYEPIDGLKRSKVTRSKEQKSTTMTITLPSSDPVAANYVAVQPSTIVDVLVWRVQPDSVPADDQLIIFYGYISAAVFKDQICELRCVPFNELYERQAPRVQYQGLCNHVLYDTGCTLNEASFKYSGTVIGVTEGGTKVDVAGVPTADLPFIGGFMQLPDLSEQRLILDQVGSVLTILLPFKATISGGTIDLYYGCDHTPQTCARKFGNILNYGGFPFVPTSNPFNLTQFTKE